MEQWQNEQSRILWRLPCVHVGGMQRAVHDHRIRAGDTSRIQADETLSEARWDSVAEQLGGYVLRKRVLADYGP